MRIDRTTAAAADRLNQVWDSLVDGEEPVRGAVTPDSKTDRQLETLVLYLESLKPAPSAAQRGAMRTRVGQSIGKELAMPSTTLFQGTADGTANVRKVARTRSRIVPVIRAFDRLVAAALILVVIAALVLLGPVRGMLEGGEPGRFAAMLGFDEESSGPDVGGQLSTSIEVRPSDYEGGTVEVGLWEVTLAPGSAMSAAPASGESTSDPLGFSVSQGSVLFGTGDTERPVEEGESVGDLAGIDYVRNPNTSSAHLLVLAPMSPGAGFPLMVGAWPPGGAVASPVNDAATIGPDPVLIGSVQLDDESAFQYRVLVSEHVFSPGMEISDTALLGPPQSTLHTISLRDGQLTFDVDGTENTPHATQALGPGNTIRIENEGVIQPPLRVTGTENVRALGLSSIPAADNHTLDQTLESIAPFWGEWTVPESGEVSLAVRRLVLHPGGTYSLPTDAGVLYHVVSGSANVIERPSGLNNPVAAGGTIAQIPGAILAFQNPGPVPVELIQVVISGVHKDAFAAESPDLVGVEWLVQETETLPPGSVTLMLEVHEYNGENDGASAGESGQSLVLITSVHGEISVRRDGGEAEVVTGIGDRPVQPPLGESVRIEPGGYLVAEPGAGWFVTGASGAPSTGLVFSISPNPEPGSTPIATPAPGSTSTVTLIGDSSSCDIMALTGGNVANALATPSTSGSPLERSVRELDGRVADRLTTDAIVYRMQEYADCVATGDYTRIYAFYSNQAIRESEVIQDLVRSNHRVEAGPSVQISFEDLRIFPDGRAGVRAVIDGEATYLTFIYEDGAWKIDVWDDSNGVRVPLATPAA